MSPKSIVNGNAALKSDDETTRVTSSARSFYRTTTPARSQNISLVPAVSLGLLSKEEDCCSRATD